MEALAQVVIIGVLLTLTVAVVLSETGEGRTRTERAPSAKPVQTPTKRRRSQRDLEDRTRSLDPVTDQKGPRTPAATAPPPMASALRTALRPSLGAPALHPDPDRLIQTEVLELAGPAARTGALIRLVFWLLLAGLGIGMIVLGVARGIALFFENLLGV